MHAIKAIFIIKIRFVDYGYCKIDTVKNANKSTLADADYDDTIAYTVRLWDKFLNFKQFTISLSDE